MKLISKFYSSTALYSSAKFAFWRKRITTSYARHNILLVLGFLSLFCLINFVVYITFERLMSKPMSKYFDFIFNEFF